jgi:hypothetical protein
VTVLKQKKPRENGAKHGFFGGFLSRFDIE